MLVSPKKDPSFFIFADAVAFAQNKHHITLFNPAANKKVLRLHRLIGYNQAITAVTGVGLRMEVKRCDTVVGGSNLAVKAYDTSRLAQLEAITATTGSTVSNEDLMYAFAMHNDEIPLTSAGLGATRIDVFTSDQDDLEHGLLRPGQGITLKQITASTIGTYGWQLIFTQEPYLP